MYEQSFVIGTVKNVQKVVDITRSFEEDIDIVKGRYLIDAKSIMGIFSLDVSESITFIIHTDDEAKANKLFTRIKEELGA